MPDVYCQSCGMPLAEESQFGTERDGSKSPDYCNYCYQEGAFTWDTDMEAMIRLNLQYLDHWKTESGEQMTAEQARAILEDFLPHLKRWKWEQ